MSQAHGAGRVFFDRSVSNDIECVQFVLVSEGIDRVKRRSTHDHIESHRRTHPFAKGVAGMRS